MGYHVNMSDIEIYVHIAFYNFGIFQNIFHTSIYFWKLPFVSDMYHSYFRTSLFCNCRKPYWNWAYTFLNCTWWMTKPGHIFKIFPLLGLRTLYVVLGLACCLKYANCSRRSRLTQLEFEWHLPLRKALPNER